MYSWNLIHLTRTCNFSIIFFLEIDFDQEKARRFVKEKQGYRNFLIRTTMWVGVTSFQLIFLSARLIAFVLENFSMAKEVNCFFVSVDYLTIQQPRCLIDFSFKKIHWLVIICNLFWRNVEVNINLLRAKKLIMRFYLFQLCFQPKYIRGIYFVENIRHRWDFNDDN